MTIKKHIPLALSAAVAAGSLSMGAVTHASSLLLEEVVVTATRREETAKTIPISVSSLGAEQLEVFGVQDVTDLSSAIPNLTIVSTGGSSTSQVLNIRGLLNRSADATVDTAVGVYADDVFLARSYSVLGQMLDVERVEVLRGPQGTLFGRSTIGGAIQVISKKPEIGTDDYDGKVKVGVGNFGLVETDVAGTLPLGETAAVRIAHKTVKDDGYTRTHFVDGDFNLGTDTYTDGVTPITESYDSNDQDSEAYRVSFAWEPTEATRIDLSYYHSESDTNGPLNLNESGDLLETNLIDPMNPAAGSVTTVGQSSFFDQYEGVSSVRTFSESDVDVYTLKLQHSFDAFDVKFIASRAEAEVAEAFNTDGTISAGPAPAPLRVAANNVGEVEQDTYELQFSGSTDRVDWLVGLYYFEEEALDQNQNVIFSPNAFAQATGVLAGLQTDAFVIPFGIDIDNFGSNREAALAAFTALAEAGGAPPEVAAAQAAGALGVSQIALLDVSAENDSSSIYGSFAYNLNDSMKVRLGMRYTEDTKGFVGRTILDSQVDSVIPGLDGIESICLYTGEIVGPGDTCTSEGVAGFPEEEEFENFTWDLSFDWQVNDDVFAFAKVATGYRTGGFSLNANSIETAQPFDEDEVISYEAGVKMDIGDAANLSVTAFYVDYSDIQLSVIAQTCLPNETSPVILVCNVGDATSQGLEIEGAWQMTDSFGIKWDVGYTDLENERDGVVPVFTPEWSLNLTAIHDTEIAGYPVRSTLSYQASDSWNSTDEGVLEANGVSNVAGHRLVNARVSVDFTEQLQFSIWGRNLTDDEYFGSAISGSTPFFALDTGIAAKPLSYGAEVTYRF